VRLLDWLGRELGRLRGLRCLLMGVGGCVIIEDINHFVNSNSDATSNDKPTAVLVSYSAIITGPMAAKTRH
jgi:hypothetical protein